MPAAIIGPVAGAVAGGLMSKGGGGQTTSKEPWAEAAPWLKQNLQTGQALQNYYQQNPFNQQQQIGYQNLFSDIDNYRNAVSPGLLAITNKYLGKGGSPGITLLSAGAPGKADGAGYAPMAQSFGLLNFDAMNPFKNGAISQERMDQERKAAETEEERLRKLREEEEAMRRSA